MNNGNTNNGNTALSERDAKSLKEEAEALAFHAAWVATTEQYAGTHGHMRREDANSLVYFLVAQTKLPAQ